MNFGDIFKTTFLDGYQASDITTTYVVFTLAITCIISLYVFMIYRLTSKKVFYSLNFNISLVATSLITATIIFTIQSSIVISLGMVGALSIVRFRTAIKDPMDLVYLFWAIAIGIICEAGLAQFAVLLSILLTVVIVLLSRIKDFAHPQILVINADTFDVENTILDFIKSNLKKYKIKSRTVNQNSYNIVIECSVHEANSIVTDLCKIEGVYSVSLVSHDGEVTY